MSTARRDVWIGLPITCVVGICVLLALRTGSADAPVVGSAENEERSEARAPTAPRLETSDASRRPIPHASENSSKSVDDGVHGDEQLQDRVRFDLTIPKARRRFCTKCDSYRSDLEGRFSREQGRLLDRLSQFSDYTASEVWRIAASSDQALRQLEGDVKPLLQTYNAKSLKLFEVRSDLARQLRKRGMVHDQADPPTDTDSSVIVGRRGGRYQVVHITPGLDAAFDRALQDRTRARAAFQTSANHVLTTYAPR